MSQQPKYALTAALAGLIAASAALAQPSFKTGKDKEKEAFCKEVFAAIIKGTRSDPREITLEKFSYADVKGKAGRKALTLTGSFKGSLTKTKFNETWTLQLDTSDAKQWEVLKMDVKTDHRLKPKKANIDKVIQDLNK